MKTISDILNSIGLGIEAIVTFLSDTANNLADMAEGLLDAVADVTEWLGYFFPSELVTIFLAIIAVAVLYKILGREG